MHGLFYAAGGVKRRDTGCETQDIGYRRYIILNLISQKGYLK
jgi:hypothetical protein